MPLYADFVKIKNQHYELEGAKNSIQREGQNENYNYSPTKAVLRLLSDSFGSMPRLSN